MLKSKIKNYKSFLYQLLGILLIVILWYVFSYTIFSSTNVLTSPHETIINIINEYNKPSFYKSISNTVASSTVAFVVSFILASSLSILTHFISSLKFILKPTISILRSMPTMACILILLLLIPSKYLPISISFLVVFPLIYENLYSSIESTDKNLIEMAKIYNISNKNIVFKIYLKHALPTLWALIISSFGLNIKVVIASEVLGMPSISIGHMILQYKQSFDFSLSFAWLVIAVIISYLFEVILTVFSRLTLPWIYQDLSKLKKLLNIKLNIKYQPYILPKNKSIEIKVEKVNISFDKKIVLNNFSDTFKTQQLTSIIAPVGSGKTTLLSYIASNYDKAGIKISYVFQQDRLIPELTVRQNLSLVLHDSKLSVAQINSLIKDTLSYFNYQHITEMYPHQLSGGMKSIVSLCRAIVYHGDILLLDEPFNSLDLVTKNNVYSIFNKILTINPLTTLLVTHNIDEALSLSNEIHLYSSSPLTLQKIITLDYDCPRDIYSKKITEDKKLITSLLIKYS